MFEAIDQFSEGFAGDVITSGDPRYDQTRRVWNGMIDRRPLAIVRPTSSDGVVATFGFVRSGEPGDIDRDLAPMDALGAALETQGPESQALRALS